MAWGGTIGGAAGLACLLCQAAAADGYFLQGDAGTRTQSVVASASRGPLNYGFNISNYDEGHSSAISLTYTIPLAEVAVLKAGPTLGLQHEQDKGNDLQAGLKLSVERYMATGFGSTYALIDVSTVHHSWFLLGQMTLAPANIGVELSRGGSDSYHETTLALQKRVADGPFSIRVGYKLTSEELFAGFSINTF
ncbi:hypothetical protein [Paracoccus sp. (in: a-proteobacteria)]|uniref:hypothetical protein n=1 Tax=Paracoccus sp. TaxID=267 RepID=UPI00396CDCAA